MPERGSQRVHIGAQILGLKVQRLRSDVEGSAPQFPCRRLVLVELKRQTKVYNFGVLPFSKQNIPRLDVPVNQSRTVGRLEALGHLEADAQHLSFWHTPVRLHEAVQRALIHQLHGNVEHSVSVPGGIYTHHMGMVDACGQSGFAFKLGG